MEEEQLAKQQAQLQAQQPKEFVPKLPSKNPLLAQTSTSKTNPLPKIGGIGGNPLGGIKSSGQVLAPPISQQQQKPKPNLFDDDEDDSAFLKKPSNPTQQPQMTKPLTQKPKGNLFDDDDEDDGMFAKKTATKPAQ